MSTPNPTALPSWMADGGALFGIGLGEEVTSKTMAPQVQIGPYRLVEKLGEGGLGVVWRAVQTSPIQREVAIKLTKSRLHHRADVLTRFEMERQALARMQHPNIAAILDAGSLPDGRPYFVMELVHGVPLTDYCAKQSLSVRARLELFITICQAVHHAHQKGILHRDLKPSNILVTEQDGKPEPKVIDFGIAKALDDTDPAFNDPFFKTQIGALPFATYQYMSPEQASRGQTDIDTRSDIYTLGVILYELLTGKLPLPDELARAGNFDAIASFLRDTDPTRPSERVTEMGTKTSDLRGDLDWIVLRALERDRERRYTSASALSDDLQRHLNHEPVNAGPPSALYRCRKWMQRHRVAFVSIIAVVISLCAGFVSTWIALQREAAQRRVAEEHRREADAQRLLAEQREREALRATKAEQAARTEAESAKHIAETARDRAEQLINDMLFDLRDRLEPLGRLSLLDQVSQSALKYFDEIPPESDDASQQRHRAAMLQNLGSLELAKGKAGEALSRFQQSLSLIQSRVTKEPTNVQALHDLALAHERVGSAHEALNDLDQAAKHYGEMQRLFDHLDSTAPKEGVWRVDRAVADERLGDLAQKRQQAPEAIAHYQAGVTKLSALTESDQVRRRLAILKGKLGALDKDRAAEHYASEAALWARVRSEMPDDVHAIAGEAIAHGHLAAISQGGEAVTHASTQVTLLRSLTQVEPGRVDWQHDLGVALLQLGVAHEGVNQVSDATRAYLEAETTLKQLKRFNHDLAAIELRLAAISFRQNDTAKAREYAAESLRLLERDESSEAKAWRETAQTLLQSLR